MNSVSRNPHGRDATRRDVDHYSDSRRYHQREDTDKHYEYDRRIVHQRQKRDLLVKKVVVLILFSKN